MERTRQEVIEIFEQKQQNAETQQLAIISGNGDQAKGKRNLHNESLELNGVIKAYADVVSFLNDCTIVERKEPKHFICPPPGEDESQALSEEKKLLEPLCNKCSKTNETCPFKRFGSAYEDCSGFESQLKPQRNDRLREFDFQDIGTATYDATKISYISEYYNKISIDGHPLYMGYGYNYAELIEWWKYWNK